MSIPTIGARNGDGLRCYREASQPQTVPNMRWGKRWQQERRGWRSGQALSEPAPMTLECSSDGHIQTRLYQMIGKE